MSMYLHTISKQLLRLPTHMYIERRWCDGRVVLCVLPFIYTLNSLVLCMIYLWNYDDDDDCVDG